jgi:ligand-binding sensor protein
MARDSSKPAIVECDAGLLKLVVPIFVNDEFVGAVGACGVLLDDGEPDAFMIERTVGMDEAKIESLSSDIKSITTEEAEALAEYITGRIDIIVDDFKKRK